MCYELKGNTVYAVYKCLECNETKETIAYNNAAIPDDGEVGDLGDDAVVVVTPETAQAVLDNIGDNSFVIFSPGVYEEELKIITSIAQSEVMIQGHFSGTEEERYMPASEFLEYETTSPDDLWKRGLKVYRELSLFEKAENTILKVILKNPESLNYKCELAQIYIAEKKYEKALEIVDEILNANENYIAAYQTGAETAFEMHDYEKAKTFAQEAIALDMNFAPGYYYLALVRLAEKDYDEAIECMKRAIMYDVNNAGYYAQMSKIYKEKEDYKTALEYIKEAESISQNLEYRIMYKELASLNKKI